MNLHELSPAPGSKRASVRVGRGLGSGLGKTSGKGQKGQKSRSGGVKRPGFEGGQKPLYLRLPKRGFYNRFGMNYVEINVGCLNCFEDGTVVEPVMLIEHGMIKNIRDGVRILGNGELTKKLTVQAMGFSRSAEEKIIAAGIPIFVPDSMQDTKATLDTNFNDMLEYGKIFGAEFAG